MKICYLTLRESTKYDSVRSKFGWRYTQMSELRKKGHEIIWIVYNTTKFEKLEKHEKKEKNLKIYEIPYIKNGFILNPLIFFIYINLIVLKNKPNIIIASDELLLILLSNIAARLNKIFFAPYFTDYYVSFGGLTNKKFVRVPPGTQNGTILRLQREGIKSGSGQGDELVHVNVRTPERLTPEERKLIEELSKEFEADKLGVS